MSHTSPRPRRSGRLAASLTVAAATATTLLGATPAYAQAGAVPVVMSGSTMSIDGTSFADSISVSGGGGTVTVSNLLGQVRAKSAGCTQLGATVRCSGVSRISFAGNAGDDSFTNNTATPSSAFGLAGNDRLTGGSVDDRLFGGSGVDFAFGRGGTDSCTAENESGCEI